MILITACQFIDPSSHLTLHYFTLIGTVAIRALLPISIGAYDPWLDLNTATVAYGFSDNRIKVAFPLKKIKYFPSLAMMWKRLQHKQIYYGTKDEKLVADDKKHPTTNHPFVNVLLFG